MSSDLPDDSIPEPDPDVDTDVDPEDPTPCAYTEYREGTVSGEVPATGEDADGVEQAVWDRLYDIEDPEMPVSIVDLGLIYGVAVEDRAAIVEMTLTYSGCPAREMLMDDIEAAVGDVDGVENVDLRLVWSPAWTVDMVTETGREHLKEFGLSI